MSSFITHTLTHVSSTIQLYTHTMPSESKYQKQQTQPRDAKIISLILQSLGVEQYDPKVVVQLLEFAHRE